MLSAHEFVIPLTETKALICPTIIAHWLGNQYPLLNNSLSGSTIIPEYRRTIEFDNGTIATLQFRSEVGYKCNFMAYFKHDGKQYIFTEYNYPRWNECQSFLTEYNPDKNYYIICQGYLYEDAWYLQRYRIKTVDRNLHEYKLLENADNLKLSEISDILDEWKKKSIYTNPNP